MEFSTIFVVFFIPIYFIREEMLKIDFNPEYVVQLAVLINLLEKKIITVDQYDESLKHLKEKCNI